MQATVPLPIQNPLKRPKWLFEQIFFPRDVEGEIAAKNAASKRRSAGSHGRHPKIELFTQYEPSHTDRNSREYLINLATKSRSTFPQSQDGHVYGQDGSGMIASPQLVHKEGAYAEADVLPHSLPNIAHTLPVQRWEDVEMSNLSGLTEGNLSPHNLSRSPSKLNPIVHNFTSPIDLYGGPQR
ncbi:hypothetical protein DFH09DRAFT_1305900 [Mycena vulgaris]|nr:hypothetical protein DFH09DRAFT_1305900 [Mycena vulgaris]